MDNFQELLHRYTNRTATQEEREAFFSLIHSGEYDGMIISEGVREMLNADLAQASSEEKFLHDSRDRIFALLIAKHSIPARSKVIPMMRIWMAAAAVITLAIAGYVWIVMKKQTVSRPLIVHEDSTRPALYSGKQVVDLPDGTRVILNENSELSYSKSFCLSNREVTLVGEASFDVTHDPSRPFIVRTGKVNTKVLGTAFNINAYPEQNEITVTVIRGLVEVGDDQKVYGKISPDQQMAVNTTTYDFVRINTKAEEEIAWQSNFLILDDVSLEEAATAISKKFQVNISFENPALKACKFYGSFLNDENLTDILNMMSPVLHIDYKIENGNVIISGKGCN
jgi:transmembrane sensor